jgi:NAD(P)H-hydrate epimerase
LAGAFLFATLVGMTLILNRNQVREVDRRAVAEYGMSGLVLMENAGRGAADVVYMQFLGCKPDSGTLTPALSQREREGVVVVCGKGNNGGDGFVIARHLDLRRWSVRVLLLCEPRELGGDVAANFAIIKKAGIEIQSFISPLEVARFDEAIFGAAYLVDAILGTGATGEPKSPYAEAIERMNASGIPIMAVDLPSGLDCDTGAAAQHTIRARHTCTFVAAKPGFFVEGAKQYVGEIRVCDIGVPRRLVDEMMGK